MLINKKVNLLAIKIQSLQEQLLAYKEIIHHAASEVDDLFRKRHPELFKNNTSDKQNIVNSSGQGSYNKDSNKM